MTTPPLNITIHSYGSVTKNKPACRYLIDVIKLRDPVGQKDFIVKDFLGTDRDVQDFVKEDERVPAIIDECVNIVAAHVGGNKEPYVSIGFHDHHGRWIAPAVAELVADGLDAAGYPCAVTHHELET